MTIEETIEKIQPLNQTTMQTARERQDQLTKPRGSLGRLEELSIQLAGIYCQPIPIIKDKVIVTMAGDHGVVAEGVSAFPQEVTSQMVLNFLRGGAAINVLARHVGARVVIVDMGVARDFDPHPSLVVKKIARGTANIARGPAMTRAQAEESIQSGIEVVETEIQRGLDIVGTGEMGIGNTTPSAAIAAALGWLLGGISLAGWDSVLSLLPYLALGFGGLLLSGHALNLMQFGDDQAQQLGLNVTRARTLILAAASLTTAAAVAFAGIIGFIGLVVPHIVRLWFGADYRRVIPLSILLGASALLISDVIARVVIAPQEIPVGIVTALAGAPFFLWVLRRAKNQGYW